MTTLRFRAAVPAALLGLQIAAGAAFAQQVDLPRPSPNASVTQSVGVTEITVKYSRPGVKGREIWGKLVPYGEVWRAGANENTTIKFSTAVKIDGHELPAGVYGLQAIPTDGDWTVIFSKDANEWGAFSYKPEHDALRVQVKPQPAAFRERMGFDFEDVTDTSAKVVLSWEKLAVPFTVEVDTPGLVQAKLKETVRWQAPYQAAGYCIQNNTCLDEASRWLDASIAMQETYANLRAKALLLAKKNDAGAAGFAQRALAAAKSLPQPPDAQQIKDLEGIAAAAKTAKKGK